MASELKRTFITPEMRRFLEALPANGAPVPPRRLRLVATDAQNVARQRCRRSGYARMSLDDTGLSGWQITKKGRWALEMSVRPLPLQREEANRE